MPDWNSMEEILRIVEIFNKSIYVLAGIYLWEVLNTMSVELGLIKGTKTWKWPMGVYFFCRWSMFFALVALLISLSVKSEINCQALYSFTQFVGNSAIGTASLLLLIRTIAVWNKNWIVIILLGLGSAGHFALLLYSVTSVKAAWVPAAFQCVATDANPNILKAIYLYTMSFDAVILFSTVAGLFMSPGGRGGLWTLLFQDGLFYFFIVVSSNTVPAVLNILNLNPAMNIIATIPACVVSTICATRLFRRLQDYRNPDVYVHSTSFMNAPKSGEGLPGPNSSGSKRNKSIKSPQRSGYTGNGSAGNNITASIPHFSNGRTATTLSAYPDQNPQDVKMETFVSFDNTHDDRSDTKYQPSAYPPHRGKPLNVQVNVSESRETDRGSPVTTTTADDEYNRQPYAR